MSDEEDFEESDFDSGDDFSNSEDDWKPGKHDRVETDDEISTEGDSSDLLDSSVGAQKKSGKKAASNKSAPTKKRQSKKLMSLSLRAKLYRKYKPPPKTLNTSSSSQPLPVPSEVSKILSASEYKPMKAGTSNKKAAARYSDSESESSGNDYLVDPNNLDLQSSFFKPNNSSGSSEKPPVFDCNAGLNLTDSDGSGDDTDGKKKKATEKEDNEKKKSVISNINKASSEQIHDFRELQDFTKRMETAKHQLQNFKSDKFPGSQESTDVTKLLSLGEGSKQKPSTKRKANREMSDDSDWEDVEDAVKEDTTIQDVQIYINQNLGNARRLTSEEKKKIDLQACLKRKMNRRTKEKYILLHKTHLLCWIAHANRINRKLNNSVLMQMCLNLLPNKDAYPKGKVSIPYIESISKWYKTKIPLKSDKEYCNFKPLPPFTTSLALQIKKLGAICKRDFVFIFVIMLRALGIHCRLVINLPLIPIRPPQSALYKIPGNSAKEEKAKDEPTEKKKKVESKSKEVQNISKIHSYSKSEHAKPSSSTNSTKESPAKAGSSRSMADTSSKTAGVKSKGASDQKEGASSTSKTLAAKVKEKSSKKRNEVKTASKTVQKEANTPEKLPNNRGASTSQAASIKEKAKKVSKKKNRLASESADDIENMNSKRTNVTENVIDSEKKESNSVGDNKKKENRVLRVVLTRLKDIPESSYFSTNIPKDEFNGKEKKSTQQKPLSKAQAQENPTAKPSPKAIPLTRSRAKDRLKVPQLDGGDDTNTKTNKKVNLRKLADRNAKSKAVEVSSQKQSSAKDFDETSNSDSDFAPTSAKRVKRPGIQSNSPNKKANRGHLYQNCKRSRAVFSDNERSPARLSAPAPKDSVDHWVEVFCEDEGKWVAVNLFKPSVNNIDSVKKTATKPITYVFAWNNDNTIRDVTPRYCTQWHTVTRKNRVEKEWLDRALRDYNEKRNSRNIIEDVEFSKQQLEVPLPQTVSEYKNHPLYALERHLLKFEAIYPPNALTLGFLRKEPVYARECVHSLHSREIWVKQARVVKPSEKPYKIVKARPKWDRATNQMLEAQPLEIFGYWQTQPYEPPVAQNGIVPRNAYGNVELFKPEMLPIGTRHLQLPMLNRTCKKMNVDCAQAVIGFDFHGGSSHPTFDGFVVCEEFADAVVEQWWEDQKEADRKEREKHTARIVGNWKKLVQGLFIRERLKRKFNFGAKGSDDGASTSKH